MFRFDDADSLALLYHLNSGVWGNAAAYTEQVHEPSYRDPSPGATLLPASELSEVNRLAANRRSCRRFADAALPATTLANILHAAYGITGTRPADDASPGYGRTVPSAGALYPLDIYAAVESVEEIVDGVYRFNPLGEALEPIGSTATAGSIRSHLLQPEACEHANAILVLTAEFGKTISKYGPRGYRYILFEAGHVSQNVCLAAVSSGLQTLCLGGFSDADINSDLGLDGRSRAALYCIAIGRPADHGGQAASSN